MGTRIINFHIINLDLSGTITTTEDTIDDVRTLDGNTGGRYCGCITTTIHILDTGQVATLDNNERTIFSPCWHIVSLVTATIYSSHIVSGASRTINIRLSTSNRPLHTHLHQTCWRTLQVVTTEDLTSQGHCIVSCSRIEILKFRSIKKNIHSGCCRCIIICRIAAAEDVTIDGICIEININSTYCTIL